MGRWIGVGRGGGQRVVVGEAVHVADVEGVAHIVGSCSKPTCLRVYTVYATTKHQVIMWERRRLRK